MKYSRLWCGSFSTSLFSFSQSCLCHICLLVSQEKTIFHLPLACFPQSLLLVGLLSTSKLTQGLGTRSFSSAISFSKAADPEAFSKAAGACCKPADPEAFSKAAGSFSKAADPEAFSKAAGFLEQPAPFTNFTLALGAMALQKLSTLSTLACAAEPKHYKKKACMLRVNMYAKQDAFTLLQNSWIFCRRCRSISNLGEKLYSKLQASGLKPFPRHQVRQPWPFPRLSATLFGIEPLPHGNCLCFCQVILFQGCFDLIYDLLKIRSPSFRHFHHQSKLFQAISGALQVGPLGILGDSLPQLDPWLSARVLTSLCCCLSLCCSLWCLCCSLFQGCSRPLLCQCLWTRAMPHHLHQMLLFLRHPAAWQGIASALWRDGRSARIS